MAGYSGTPLVKKLGIKPASALSLVGAPAGFRRILIGLPRSVRVSPQGDGHPDLMIWFVRSRAELTATIARRAFEMGSGLWIAWPKKASGVRTDVTEDAVRNAGLAHGLVDYKVCAIDETWSGLKFARRARRPQA